MNKNGFKFSVDLDNYSENDRFMNINHFNVEFITPESERMKGSYKLNHHLELLTKKLDLINVKLSPNIYIYIKIRTSYL